MAGLICTRCRAAFSTEEKIWRCPCGGLLDLQFQAAFPLAKIKERKPTLWRYREALPVIDDRNILSFDEGFTPLLPVQCERRTVWLKEDHLFPTGSYKDRGASVLISKVKELGIATVVEDSSGNAGCAIAAYCARGEIGCRIFVPEDTSPAKLAQIRWTGAELRKIPGPREETARAVLEEAERTYYASHSWNPFFFHGTKTLAFEVCEQLGWSPPDTVLLPAGNGTLVLGAAIGFRELMEAGIIRRIPRIVAVQSARCAPLNRAFAQGADEAARIEKQDTLAEGIAIAAPIRGAQILKAVRLSNGLFIAVEDEEIVEALRDLGRRGFYVEPTAAAAVAALRRYLNDSPADEIIVAVLTGHGLKSTEKMLKLL